MSKFNKIFIYTSVIFTSIPFWVLALTKIKIIAFPIILTLFLVIGVFHLIDKIHPTLLFGKFNLSKFNKNLFISSLTMFILLMTSLGVELVLKDKELLDKLSKTEDLGANTIMCIITISFIIWCVSHLFKDKIDFANEYDTYYRKCTIKSEIEVERFNIGYSLIFDVELDTPIDKEKHFKLLTKQLELKEVLKENQKIIIKGFLSTTEIEQEDSSIQIYKSINGEIMNKDFVIKHKINSLKDEFKNLKSKGANK